MNARPAPLPPHAGQPILSQGQPLGKGRAVIIMVHGRNASPRNILDLVPLIGHPDLTYLAPAAAGGTWYPLSFMSDIPQNEPGISSGISVIHGLIDQAMDSGVASERILLLGFSQGACLSSTAVQRRPQRYGGLLVFSGGLIGPPGTSWTTAGSLAGTPVFLGCSDIDAHVPRQRVAESAEAFRKAGGEVTERIYPGMGHLINKDEIDFAQSLIAKVVQ